MSTDVLKQMLPLVASVLMGAMAKRQAEGMGGSPAQSGAPAAGGVGGLLGTLGPLLDQNRDGSMLDDVMGMLGRFRSGS